MLAALSTTGSAVQMRSRVLTSSYVFTRVISVSSVSQREQAAAVPLVADGGVFVTQRISVHSTMAFRSFLYTGLMSPLSKLSVSSSRGFVLPSVESSHRFFTTNSKDTDNPSGIILEAGDSKLRLKLTKQQQQQLDADFIKSASLGNLNSVQDLLQTGANVNAMDSESRTALIMASFLGHLDVVRELLKHDEVEANVLSEEGITALMGACLTGHLDIVRELLKHDKVDANVCAAHGPPALMMASLKGHMDVLRELLKHDKVDVNTKIEQGHTVLMVACNTGLVDVVRELVNHNKLDVNAKNELGFTSLMIASAQGHLEVVLELLKHDKVEVNAGDSRGFTAVMIASFKGHMDVVRELVKHDIANASKRGE